MPLFRNILRKKAPLIEVPPTTYDITISHLKNIVSTIDSNIPNVDTVANYVEDNKLYILSALFVLLTFIILVPLSSALDSYHKEVKSEEDTSMSKLLNVSEGDITALTASSNDDDDSSDENNGDDISDDGSVDLTYEDFLKSIPGQINTSKNQDMSELDTPTSSPPVSPSKRSKLFSKKNTDGDDRSVRSSASMKSLKKKLSTSFGSKSMKSKVSFIKRFEANVKANH